MLGQRPYERVWREPRSLRPEPCAASAKMDVDLTQIQGQLGTAILDVTDGKIVKATGQLDGDEGQNACTTLYRMLQDTAKCLDKEPMRRLSISFADHAFIVTLSERHVHIVKKQKVVE